ncbi:MAG: SRPBCC family protein [Myxococcota bacterium]|nr:SRPBCC family protein [Myxococcota bacterium]
MNTTGLLRKTLIMLAVMLTVVFGIGFMLPDTFHVERTLIIDTPAEKPFKLINDLTQWPLWDPWTRADPDIKQEVSGTAGPGQEQTWLGPRSSTGKLKIIESVANKNISVEMYTTDSPTPRRLTFTFQDLGQRTKLTWAIDGDNTIKPIGNWFGLGMDDYLGPMYEQGLSNIKSLSETGKLPSELKPLGEENKPKLN